MPRSTRGTLHVTELLSRVTASLRCTPHGVAEAGSGGGAPGRPIRLGHWDDASSLRGDVQKLCMRSEQRREALRATRDLRILTGGRIGPRIRLPETTRFGAHRIERDDERSAGLA